MSIIESVKNEVMLLSEKFASEADDKYDFWDEHIRYVVQEALVLAERYKADSEIVELAAMLHDVALVSKIGTRENHHETGAEISKAMLSKYNYPQVKADKVISCVNNHRSSKNCNEIEEICVADADVLAHFRNIPLLFKSAFKRLDKDFTLNDLRDTMKEYFERDYNDLSDRTKQDFSDRYKIICQIVLGDEHSYRTAVQNKPSRGD